MRSYFHEFEDVPFGTVPGFSAALVNDLRTSGKAAFTFLGVRAAFAASAIKGEYSGTLAGLSGQGVFEYYVLDNSANPIVLRTSGGVRDRPERAVRDGAVVFRRVSVAHAGRRRSRVRRNRRWWWARRWRRWAACSTGGGSQHAPG